MRVKGRRKKHAYLLSELLRYGWRVEVCYATNPGSVCSASLDQHGKHVFHRVVADGTGKNVVTTATPSISHARSWLTFVLVQTEPGKSCDGCRVVRTWNEMRDFVDEARSDWVMREIMSGRLGEKAKSLFEAEGGR